MFWGLSEVFDIYNEYQTIFNKIGDVPEENEGISNGKQANNHLNILLFGANDPRHLLKTMAKLYTHKEKGHVPILNFYIIDACVEIVARNIALLAIALENPKQMSIRNKTHLFMDVYGNSLMRASSDQYLVDKASSCLLKIVTDDEWLKKLAPMLNIDKLKYRERDGIANAFNFWFPRQESIFNISSYWSDRVRKLLGVRYDYREGQFDWDLNMVLKERGGNQICSQEYRYWRECGIAFTFPEFEYSKPNKTLCAGLVRNGNKFVHRGYVGDIQTGPYAAYGLSSSDKVFLKSVHGNNDYRSTDVTERNLLELFHELAMQTPYEHDINYSRKYGSVRLQMGKRLTCDDNCVQNPTNYEEPWINIDGVNINFLSVDDTIAIQDDNTNWLSFFDFAFVGHNYFPFLKESFTNILSPKSVVIMETKLLTVERKTVVAGYNEKLMNFAKTTKLEPVINYNALNTQNNVLKFKKILPA